MKDAPKELLWYGKAEALSERKTLHAGPASLIYEAGSLIKISAGGHEVIRKIYIALRDHNWATIVPTITDEKIDVQPDSFRISYKSVFKEGLIHLSAHVTITGNSTGQIVFEFVGEVLSEFLTNRTGFCVLHPVSGNVGKPCAVTHNNGKQQVLYFPENISPHQPMKNISAMEWKVDENLDAALHFYGEVSEMEDQRNWTDDTFKTYCRPLSLPFPYTLEKGEKISQKIVFNISGSAPVEAPAEPPCRLYYDTHIQYDFPEIGIGQPDSKPTLSPSEIELIRSEGFDYYEIEVMFESSWISELNNALDEAESLELKVFLKAYFTDNFDIEINQLAKVIGKNRERILSLLVLREGEVVTTEAFISMVAERLRGAFPVTRIGAGTAGFYAQINRRRILSKEIDFIAYSVNPQVHAFDNQTLVENLNGLSDTVKSAKIWAEGKSVYISRVTLKMQVNPATTSVHTIAEKELPDKVDLRQMSLFGAGWVLGSLKYLTEEGVGAVTYFQTIGERGIIQGDSGSKYPKYFIVDKGAIFPMFYVFGEVLKHKEGKMLKSISSHPELFEGMVIQHHGKKTILLANFSGDTLEVQIDGIAANAVVRKLDEKNALLAMYKRDEFIESPWCDIQITQPITTIRIRPFGLVFIQE